MTSRSSSSSSPPCVTQATCGAKPSTCSASRISRLSGMNSGKYALTCPVALNRSIEALLDQLPDGVAVRPDDHAALDRRVVGQLGASDDVEVPAREVLGLGRDLGDERLLLCRLVPAPCCSVLSAMRVRSSSLRGRGTQPHSICWCHRASLTRRFQCISSRVGKVGPVVAAPALLAPQRGPGDQPADGEQAGRAPVRRRAARARRQPAPTAPARQARARPRAASSPSRVRNSPTCRHISA